MRYPDPERLWPERFLERRFGPHEWFPLGGGNRVCPGMPFALYMKVLFATAGSAGIEPVRSTGLSFSPFVTRRDR